MSEENKNRKPGRPRKYDKKKTSTIRFYIHEDDKTEIQIYGLKNKVTLQELYDKATEDILEMIREDD